MKLANARDVELPVGNALAIRAPAKAAYEFKFLFVRPIEYSVEAGAGSVLGKLLDTQVPEILNEEIIVPDVADPSPIGGQLGVE